jgi:two-component system, OmpR family, phosphate regulon sensor histidine kinase PhoR
MLDWRGRLFSSPGWHLAWRLALIGAGTALVWAVFGKLAALVLLSLAALMYAAQMFYNTALLRAWLREPQAYEIPDGVGIWSDIFSRLYRLLRLSKQSTTRIARELDRFQQAGAALPDGIAILNQTGEIEWCNPVTEAHFAIDLERDRGQPISYLIRQPDFVAHLQHGSTEPLVLRDWRGLGLTLAVQVVPYGDAQKLIVSRDITQLERAETVRRDFVANVSHELRTPLTVVSGFLETLEDMEHSDSKMLSRSIQLMREQTARMQRLVEDLLTLSRLESGQALHEEPVDLPAMVRGLQREAEQMSKRAHRISARVDSGFWVRGGDTELHSALANLVTNAVRYTPAEGEVRIAWEQRDGEGVFSVEDNGMGIEAEHIPRLTERFYRVDKSRSRMHDEGELNRSPVGGGTGLGLAIVKHVLQRHQARLEIQSEPGKGSRFAAHFPKHRLLTPPTPAQARAAAPSASA